MKCYKCGIRIEDNKPCILENLMCKDCWEKHKPRPYWWRMRND